MKFSREAMDEALASSDNTKRNKRGAMSVAKIKAIGELAWTAGEGEVED